MSLASFIFLLLLLLIFHSLIMCYRNVIWTESLVIFNLSVCIFLHFWKVFCSFVFLYSLVNYNDLIASLMLFRNFSLFPFILLFIFSFDCVFQNSLSSVSLFPSYTWFSLLLVLSITSFISFTVFAL
jgi:hypothetical protein